jgi:phosphatidate cytidylyltransferase
VDERPTWERHDDDDSEPASGDPTEGVRIIGAEEAAEALERGDVAHRRGDGMPRMGDRPESPPTEGPRPALRFPLPGGGGGEAPEVARPRVSPAPGLPHWTDPPTGEVPKILAEEEPAPAGSGDDESDDLEAWSAFTTSGPRWRDQPGDWDQADFDESMVHDDETRVGALDESDRPAPDDYFFEEPAPEPGPAPEPEPVFVRSGGRPVTPGTRPFDPPPGGASRREPPPEPPAGERDVRVAVITGVSFAVAALVLFSLGPAYALVLVAAVIVLCAAELFDALRRGGFQPATLLGLVATGALVGGAYWRGEAAQPLVMGLLVVFTVLWYLVGVTRAQPTNNAAVTIFGVAWIGLLGSFAALMLKFPNGRGMLIGVIVATVAADVAGFATGRRMGRTALAPEISPNKTVEGLVGGAVGAIVASVVVLHLNPWGLAPWDMGSALALGVVVAVAAPLGDLCESMVKRDLGIKDMGSVLPGHGGLLDRFDAMLFTLPAAYYLIRLLELV